MWAGTVNIKTRRPYQNSSTKGSASWATNLCADAGVAFYDTIPDFRATPPKTTRFFTLNKHFTPEGNAFTAAILARYLRQNGLVR